MPRNPSGVYSLPEAPFVANTPISSAVVNDDFSDIATALTDSLSRNAQGGMNGLLSLDLTGFNYTADPNTGMSRSAADTQVITCGGSDWTFTSTDVTSPSGASLLALIGEIKMWALSTAPSGWILMRGQACTTSYPLWRAALIADGNPYGTSGGDPLFPNLQTRVPAGVDVNTGGLNGSGTLGAVLGNQSRTLLTENLPPYTPTGSNAASVVTGTISGQNSGVITTDSPTGPFATTSGGTAWGPLNGSTLSFTSGAAAPQAFTGNAQGGSSTPVTVVQPTLIVNFIGRAA